MELVCKLSGEENPNEEQLLVMHCVCVCGIPSKTNCKFQNTSKC